jgi:NAD(P)H-hydrate epimerase
MKFLNTNQLREWDEFTILNEPISSIKLVERASQNAINFIKETCNVSQNILVVCGNGNNGADGLCIAYLLAEDHYNIKVLLANPSKPYTDEASFYLEQFNSKFSGLIIAEETFENDNTHFEVLIDCILGVGLKLPLKAPLCELINKLNQANFETVISIDVPSGFPSEIDLKEWHLVQDNFIKANHTLTFQQLKPSFLFPESESATGVVKLIDIGLDKAFLSKVESQKFVITLQSVNALLPKRTKFCHKGTFGHALLIAGQKGMCGAASLSAKAIVKSGSGKTSVLAAESCYQVLQTLVPEAMVLANSGKDFLRNEPINIRGYSAVGIGPGVGTNESTLALLLEIIAQCSRYNIPLAIDADALNMIGEFGINNISFPQQCVLTPHPKEFNNLFKVQCKNAIQRAEFAKQFSQEYDISIVLKDSISILYNPNHKEYILLDSSPSLAKGGSGDILLGIITSQLAQGLKVSDAAIVGLCIHAQSGIWCAQNRGVASTTAIDILEGINQFYLQTELH